MNQSTVDEPFRFEVWPTEYRKITQHFGVNPLNYAQFGLPGHDGMDIRAPHGSKVYAVAPGEVYRVHRQANTHNYGIHVRINHRKGYQTIYGHLQKALVNEGAMVSAGDLIGLADDTGNSFGSHLHLTLKRKGFQYKNWPHNIIDPTPYLLPLLGWQPPAGPYIDGWVSGNGIVIHDRLAQANPGGITLRISADQSVHVPGGTIMILKNTRQGSFVGVKVPKAAIGQVDPGHPVTPAAPPPPSLATVDGWAWAEKLQIVGNQAVVNARHGINIRKEPKNNSQQVGILRPGSTVSLLGDSQAGYRPLRARRADFVGPIHEPDDRWANVPGSLNDLPDDLLLGWVQTHYLQLNGLNATTRHRGVSLWNRPDPAHELIGMIKGDAPLRIAGADQGIYTPVLVNKGMMFSIVGRRMPTTLPANHSAENSTAPQTKQIENTTAGWVLTSEISPPKSETASSQHQLLLRHSPNRAAPILGTIPASAPLLVMGVPLGEYTPVRIDQSNLKPINGRPPLADTGILGRARIGLHASADPDISEAEIEEFANLRPGIIKVLSFHNPEGIQRLADDHPRAAWIVRAFLDFGSRRISPAKFVSDTKPDVARTLEILTGKDVVVELHNEPNLVEEGLYKSWQDGREFAQWFEDVLKRYRQAFPGMRFIFPGLSPGSSVTGKKQDHIQFIEASRRAVEAADGLGIHLYWSNVYPMPRTLEVLDDYIGRFRNTSIWITEASNNKAGVTAGQKAREYLQFWQALQIRPVVRGVTFFVASASNPSYQEEVWVGRGIGKIVGAR